ncbi:MAG: hypothetical protein NUV32_07255 [Exilispira sp.]|jgi:hypothetical protein|nr:hypothetical protein [Exilispira sp.]
MKKYLWLIAIIILFIIAGFILKITYNFVVQSRVNVEKAISILKDEFVPLKMKIFIDGNKISYQLKFYDLMGTNVAALNNEISGNQLFIDFYVINIKDNFLFFPYLIYSNEIPPVMGKKIFDIYEKNYDGILFPEIYASENMNENYLKFISSIWQAIKSGNITFFSSNYNGNALHLLSNISEIDPNSVYEFVCHTSKGGIEIVKR